MSILTRNWRPILFIVLGLGAVLSAHYILDVCGDHGMMLETASGAKVPMRCHWSERAFQGVGGLVAFIGLAQLFLKDAVRGLSLAAAGGGTLMMLIPVWLVPTCTMDSMVCNLSFKPGALLIGGIVMVAGLLSAIQLRRLDVVEAK